ncbi:MAG: DUF2480 family protein [Flavobacteriales bacterium]
MGEIVNKVAQSGIITLELEQWTPKDALCSIDLASILFQGLVLREKEFRAWIKEHPWSEYQGRWVAVSCSADAIIPNWAWMLVSSALCAVQAKAVFGTIEDAEHARWRSIIQSMDITPYQDARVVVKGCSGEAIPTLVYMEITARLQPIAKSIMFGEPCSTVPVFKRS